MSMTASVATSLEIGNSLIASLGQTTKMRRTTVEQAAFVVLKSADIPSLLIESGYITNDADAKNLDSPRWRQKFADAVVAGITHWFYQRPPRGSLIAWQQANPQQPRLDVSYTVKRGDSLSELADQFGVTMTSLKFANEMDTSSIQVGQILTIPGTTLERATLFTEHTITRGETLSQIALTYSVTMASIRASNQLKSDTIRIGQVLKIPTS
jgi:N-acetylmuramoyl-L-alanine amidase